MRILVVEDELKTSEFLRKGLTAEGFVVEVESNGARGLEKALAGEFDLLILDVMLPDRSGWDIIAEVRRVGKQTPALFLTARDLVQDRIKGLELGADDYLVKPFSFAELLTRIRTVLRRSSPRLSDIVHIGDLVIDLTRHRVLRAGTQIGLTTQEFALLALLAGRKGEVLSRQLISDQVWGMNFDTDTNIVDVAVRRLRSKIDDPYPIKLIHTVRGVGYVLDER